METIKEEQPSPTLIEQIKLYIETRIKLARYQAIDKGSSVIANAIIAIAIGALCIVTFFFSTIALALYIGQLLGAYWMGFGCVALFYLLLAIIVAALKNKVLVPGIINALIKKILNDK